MSKVENKFVIKENRKKQSAYLLTCVILLVCLVLVIVKDFGLIGKLGLEGYINHRGTLFIKILMILLLFALIYFFISYLILVMNRDSILAIDETGFSHRFSPYKKILWQDVLDISAVSKRRRRIKVTLRNFDYYLNQLPPVSKNFLKRNGKTEDQQIICARIFTTDYSTEQIVAMLNKYWDEYKSNES